MADIDIRREHDLGLAAARVAAERMAEHLGRRFDLKGSWSGNTLSFSRPGVTGSLAIAAGHLHLTVALGFLLKALRGSIERAVHEELDELFAAHAKPAPASKPKPKAAAAKPVRSKTGPAGKKKAG